jgi:hypothetical protein
MNIKLDSVLLGALVTLLIVILIVIYLRDSQPEYFEEITVAAPVTAVINPDTPTVNPDTPTTMPIMEGAPIMSTDGEELIVEPPPVSCKKCSTKCLLPPNRANFQKSCKNLKGSFKKCKRSKADIAKTGRRCDNFEPTITNDGTCVCPDISKAKPAPAIKINCDANGKCKSQCISALSMAGTLGLAHTALSATCLDRADQTLPIIMKRCKTKAGSGTRCEFTKK